MNILWQQDILGGGYEMSRFGLSCDYDGVPRATIVRRRPREISDRCILYIHGFSDYFFQRELGERCNSRGYNFYAVDLRRYGRSYIPGQKLFGVKNLEDYFEEFRQAFEVIRQDGNTRCALLGHSTGGLSAALYMSRCPDTIVRALVLNSPFLAWNLPWYERALIPLITALACLFPELTVPQPKDIRYARSLRKEFGGEWDYDEAWKPNQMPDVDAAWVRAIELAQRSLRGGADIQVPVLVMTSTHSAKRNDEMEIFRHADGILDVDSIIKVACRLGNDVTIERLAGGLHDLALSPLPVRERYYDNIFHFLACKM